MDLAIHRERGDDDGGCIHIPDAVAETDGPMDLAIHRERGGVRLRSGV